MTDDFQYGIRGQNLESLTGRKYVAAVEERDTHLEDYLSDLELKVNGAGGGVAQWAEGTGLDQDPVDAANPYSEPSITTLDLQVGDVVLVEAAFWYQSTALGQGIYFRPMFNGAVVGDNRTGYRANTTGVSFFAQSAWIIQSDVAGTIDIGLNIQEWYASTNSVQTVKVRATVINEQGPQGQQGIQGVKGDTGPQGPAGGDIQYLDELLDVNVPTPSGQQVLTYNDLLGEWEARTPIASLGLAAFVYTFKTATDGTPGAGQIELNNADPALATEMYIHEIDSNGADIALFLEYLLVGSWCNIGERDDYQVHHHSYDVTAATNENGQIWTVPLTLFESVGGAFPNNEKINLVLRYVTASSGGGDGGRAPVIVNYNSSGTFAKDDYPGMIGVKVRAVGGGGGGGGAGATAASEASAGAGGGAGGYAEIVVAVSDLATSETITVGAGGTGGVGISQDPGDGGSTTAFGMTCSGGNGANNSAAVASGYLSGSRPGLRSGLSTGGDLNARGSAGTVASSDVQRSLGGTGGSSVFGGAGHGGNASTSTGGNGTQGAVGSGGGGGANRPSQGTNRNGGNGGGGIVVVEVLYGGGGVETTPWTAVTYQNGWLDYTSSDYAGVQYRKVGDVVQIRGACYNPGTAVNPDPIFTLPAGFRPPNIVPILTRANALTTGYSDIAVNGGVLYRSGNDGFFGFAHEFSVTA